jgi:hypothetical protein
MEITNPLLTRWICAGLVMALLTPPAAVAQDERQNATSVPPSETSQTSSPTPDASPTSTPAEAQASQATPADLPDSPDKVQPQADSQAQPSTAAQPQSNPQQSTPGKTQKPVGAAAAEVQGPTGDAAFKPAGAAIAPAKQRRTRMLLIKVGALIGAGVAIGSVAALSSGSPSRPPGAH